MKKSKAEQLLEDINSIRAEGITASSFETQVEDCKIILWDDDKSQNA